ncbi:MAG: TolC family protein [Planctomycetes bacterium]|nr:TolC family protein [Planctomycetota bacterium]
MDDALVLAASQSAALRAAFERWRSAVLAEDGAGSWPDPRLSYGYYLNSVQTRTGPMEHQIGLAQTFPWFGRTGDAEDVAAQESEKAARAFDAKREALFRQVRHAWADLYEIEHSVELTQENVGLLQNFVELLETRYMLDSARHADLIRLQLELGKLEDRLASLQELRPVRAARLNSALGLPADAPVPHVDELPIEVAHADLSGLLEEARLANPELLALDAEIALRQVRVRQAERAGSPDWTLNLGYTVLGDAANPGVPDSGSDPIVIGLSVGVPVQRAKYRAAAASARAAERAARAERENLALNLEADLRAALYRHEDATRRLELHRDSLVPKAEEALQASLTAFEADRATMLDLIDTQRSLLELGLTMVRARAESARGLADLRALVGGDLDTTETSDTGDAR